MSFDERFRWTRESKRVFSRRHCATVIRHENDRQTDS